MYNRIIFLVSSLSQPRAIRRVESIKALGYDVQVYGYDRAQYNCNKFSHDVPVSVLGEMSKGDDYLGKIKKVQKDISYIVKKHKDENCLFYSFGYFESIFLRLKGVPYAYEISDIVYGSSAFNKVRWLLHKIDQNLVKNSVFTLLTSEGFKGYLNQKANYIVQPNKVNKKIFEVSRNVLNITSEKIIFGFVGSIRYESMMRFVDTIGKYFPQHEFHFYGVANIDSTQKRLDSFIANYSNVKLFGPFKNPDDFEIIYNSIDVIVTTYGTETLNETILDPNKLYEAILFCRPLIVTDKTFLAEQVKKYDCGFCIDSSSESSVKASIEKISIKEINECSSRMLQIPREEAYDDMNNLGNLLSKIISVHSNE